MIERYTAVIGEFSIAQANALSDGVFLSAVPPLTTWVGLGTALGLRLGKEYTLTGIAPVIGETHLHRGHAKYVRYRSGQLSDVGARGIQHPTVDDRRCSLNAYVLMDFETDYPLRENDIQQALLGLRLGGGVIHPPAAKHSIAVKLLKTNDIQQVLRFLPSYFYLLEDAGHLVKTARDHGEFRGFDILTAPLRRWAGDETETELKQNHFLPQRPAWLPAQGFYRPIAVGYQLLEVPRQRHGARNDFPHAFAEPVFSLIRYRTVGSVRNKHNPKKDGHYYWHQGQRADKVLGACPGHRSNDEDIEL